MAWFKVDDGFYDHPKVDGLPNAAVGLWLKAGVWCAKHETDGVIPAQRVKVLKGTESQISALIRSGLWVESESELGAKYYSFRDWNHYQPTHKEREESRAIWRENKRKSRGRKSADQRRDENVHDGVQEMSTDQLDSGVQEMSGTYPDPTRPDPLLTNVSNNPPNPPEGNGATAPESGTNPGQAKPKNDKPTHPEAFNRFWDTYAKKVDKPASVRAWNKAVRLADPEVIVSAAGALIDRMRNNGKHPQFTPNPATWLNRHGWNDDLPPLETHTPTSNDMANEWLFGTNFKPSPEDRERAMRDIYGGTPPNLGNGDGTGIDWDEWRRSVELSAPARPPADYVDAEIIDTGEEF